jgi:hypothetical protein
LISASLDRAERKHTICKKPFARTLNGKPVLPLGTQAIGRSLADIE